MIAKFWYGESSFPEDVKNLYWGLPGTGILKILLDQFLQETESEQGKLLQDNSYADAALFKWNKNSFAYALEFENEEKYTEWKNYRNDFMAWLESTHDITCAYSEDSTSEQTKTYFFQELPAVRGFEYINRTSD